VCLLVSDVSCDNRTCNKLGAFRTREGDLSDETVTWAPRVARAHALRYTIVFVCASIKVGEADSYAFTRESAS